MRRRIRLQTCLLALIGILAWTELPSGAEAVAISVPVALAPLTPVAPVIREAGDLAELDLSFVRPRSGSAWVVARVTPGSDSGALMADGFRGFWKGKYITPGKSSNPAIKECGWVTVLYELVGTAPRKHFDYLWYVELRNLVSWGPPVEYPEEPPYYWGPGEYSPYDQPPSRQSGANATGEEPEGDMILCRVNSDATGAARLRPTYVIPEAWTQFVAQAVAYRRDHQALFDPHAVANNRPALVKLVDDPNPFISINAFLFLDSLHAMPRGAARTAVANARGLRQAVFAWIMLGTMPGKDQRAIEDITTVVQGAISAADVVGIAFTAMARQQSSNCSDYTMRMGRLLLLLRDVTRKYPAVSPGMDQLAAILAEARFSDLPGHDQGAEAQARLEQMLSIPGGLARPVPKGQ